jgi:hypothetical protein
MQLLSVIFLTATLPVFTQGTFAQDADVLRHFDYDQKASSPH